MRLRLRTSALAASLLLIPLTTAGRAATAQTPSQVDPRVTTSQRGKVVAVEGPEGSVVVLRGAQAYALLQGDLLFEGDRVFTRANGRVTLVANGCEQRLEPAGSITVDGAFCEAAPVVLADAGGTAGALQGMSAPASSVGASPALLTTLVAAGGAATAAALSEDASSSAIVVP